VFAQLKGSIGQNDEFFSKFKMLHDGSMGWKVQGKGLEVPQKIFFTGPKGATSHCR